LNCSFFQLKYGCPDSTHRFHDKLIPLNELAHRLQFVSIDNGKVLIKVASKTALDFLNALSSPGVRLQPRELAISGDLTDVSADMIARLIGRLKMNVGVDFFKKDLYFQVGIFCIVFFAVYNVNS
jgi:hypothetical protein